MKITSLLYFINNNHLDFIAMPNILVVVHLEPHFGHELEALAEQVVDYSNQFDHTINITSKTIYPESEPFYCFQLAFMDHREWLWGFDPLAVDGKIEGEDYIPTLGHEFSEILDWMKKLSKNDKYTLVGGSSGECLLDIYQIFQYLELNVSINQELTY